MGQMKVQKMVRGVVEAEVVVVEEEAVVAETGEAEAVEEVPWKILRASKR